MARVTALTRAGSAKRSRKTNSSPSASPGRTPMSSAAAQNSASPRSATSDFGSVNDHVTWSPTFGDCVASRTRNNAVVSSTRTTSASAMTTPNSTAGVFRSARGAGRGEMRRPLPSAGKRSLRPCATTTCAASGTATTWVDAGMTSGGAAAAGDVQHATSTTPTSNARADRPGVNSCTMPRRLGHSRHPLRRASDRAVTSSPRRRGGRRDSAAGAWRRNRAWGLASRGGLW